jgi:FimV-like protein
MRKLLLALTGAMLSFYSFADLGEIKVNSYLSQPLNATIPITGISEASLSELAIGLASSAKFKNNGISFSPELGSLQFKIVNSKGAPFLQISSNRAINSPVLKILLHYQQNSDDFYRQYTLLLDPIEVSNNVVSNSAAPARFKHEVVMHKITGEKPIAVSNNTSKINPNLTSKNVFMMDFTNPYVMQRLANFDQKSMIYTTLSNDNLYAIARFEQLIYPHALLNLNQIIIALGLENYPKIKPLGQPYESGVKILLPLPQDINLIQSALADQYLLGASLSSSERLGVLRAMAAAFEVSLKIESADLFAGKNSVMTVASAPVKKHFVLQPMPPAYEDKGLIDTLLEYKYYLGLGLLFALGMLLLNKRIKLRAAQNKSLSMRMPSMHPVAAADGVTINSVSDMLERNNAGERNLESFEQQELESIDNSAASIEGGDEVQSLNVSNNSLKPVDEELINTLEHLLSFDDTRDDIRYKLLELYLSANRIEAANLVYAKLDQSLDSDSSLRGNLIDICKEYDFVPHAGLAVAATEVASSKLATELMLDEPEVLIPSVADLSAQEKEQLLKKLTPEIIHEQPSSPEDLNELSREIDFTSQELVAPDVTVDALGADFASERVMDFSGFNQVSSSSVEAADTHGVPANVPEVAVDRLTHHEWSDSDLQVINSTLQDDTRLDVDANLDEKLNLAQMYYQIEELAKAREILIELINSSAANSSIKVQAQQLLTDLGLND